MFFDPETEPGLQSGTVRPGIAAFNSLLCLLCSIEDCVVKGAHSSKNEHKSYHLHAPVLFTKEVPCQKTDYAGQQGEDPEGVLIAASKILGNCSTSAFGIPSFAVVASH